jgi:hypothetical protein
MPIISDAKEAIANLKIDDKQSIVNLLVQVELGWISCRRAADEIMRVAQRDLVDEDAENRMNS